MTKLVLTAVGDEREGLLAALSHEVGAHGGNWTDSQFARLAGTFAGIVLVEIPEYRTATFEQAVAALHEEVGWRVEIAPGVPGAPPTPGRADGPQQRLTVHLMGLDRPGTVAQISAALARQHASITVFRSWTSAAPEGGGVLFEAQAEVDLPSELDPETVREALEPLADELMVDLGVDTPGA